MVSVVSSAPLNSSSTGTTKVTIKEGQSESLQCTGTNVVTIINAAYTNQSPKSKPPTNSNVGVGATPCNSDTNVVRTVRNECRNKATCTIKANDIVLLGFDDPTCKTKRPLVVEYQCAGETVRASVYQSTLTVRTRIDTRMVFCSSRHYSQS